MLDVLVILLIFFIGFNYKNRFKEFDAYDRSLLTKLFLYHLFFGVAYYFYAGESGGDSVMYWGYPKKFILSDIWFYVKEGNATKTVSTINYIPAHIMDLSFFTGFMIYTLIGYIGWVYFYRVLKENVPNFRDISQYKILGFSIFPWILFLPNLHFWSVAIGKDSLLFMCCALFLYALKDIPRRIFPLLICIVFSILIRPHILFFLISAAGGAVLLSKEIKGYKKMLLLVVFAIAFFSMIGYVMDFINIDSLDVDSIEKYASNKAAKLASAKYGSSIDISNYSLGFKIFTFLFRPFFFDAVGILGIAASLENLFLLLFSIKLLQSKPFKAFKKGNLIIKTLVFFFLIGAFGFSLTLGNLGIMLRQKTPFILVLIIFGFWTLTQRRDFKGK